MYQYELLNHNPLNGLILKIETLIFGILIVIIKYYG
jgi:hypothetical protein